MNWDERRPLNVALKDRGKTQVERVHDLLKDGQPHYHHELYALGCVAHSRVADLRRKLRLQGQDIACWTDKGPNGERVSVYQLVSLPKPQANPIGAGRACGSESETFSPREAGAAVSPPPAAPETVEGHRLLDSTKAGGSASPCSSEGGHSERHPAFAKQLSVFEASA